MLAYIARRLLQAVIVVVGVTLVVFLLIHLLPGGPARAALGPRATKAAIANFNVANGYNRAVPVQYGLYVWHLVHGNLGYSYHYNQSVLSLLEANLPKSALLVGLAFVLSLVVGVPLGLYQAIRRNKFADHAITTFAFAGYAMPNFWAGMLLILAFAISLHVLPAEAPQASSVASILADPRALVLPVVTLALVSFAQFSRFMRSSAIENLVQDYIRTARAKGISNTRVVFRHLLPNSVTPIITLIGLTLPIILSGAIVIEALFNYPGMGYLLWEAALRQDYPLLMGFTIVVGVATVMGSLLADLLYAAVDPRVRYD
ncbi:MAG TPA: ABC transporter permease [Acidimicrobiales bacterium]|nr:ABC transporter permease [Acidimicrobiales bacterium]